jgi:hypothetical protein
MFPRIVSVRAVRDYILDITFSDGAQGELDFRDRIVGRGGVFTPLQDVNYFQRVRVNPETGTIEWPNQVDLDPDLLYSQITHTPIVIPEMMGN